MTRSYLPGEIVAETAAMPDARASAACGDLAGVDRDMCRFESRIGQASGTLREEPREWRAAHRGCFSPWQAP